MKGRMKRSETQQKIISVAKREFLAKGFKDASLSQIVKKAGFTKGAFYGYYPSKAALFEEIVGEAVDGLTASFKAAQDAHFALIVENRTDESLSLSAESLRAFIETIYDHFDEFKLVICCAAGTKYADYIHELVELEVAGAERYFELLRERGKLTGSISHELHHMIAGAYFNAVFETVVHDMSREQASAYIDELIIFFEAGMKGLLTFR